jgi:glycosyltransferase involved in cell wall biosynthesis
LAANTGTDAVPSKVYRIMACARPVLVCAENDSDLAALIVQAQCGMIVQAGSPRALADAVIEAMRNPSALAAMGQAGRTHVMAHYARSSISARYERLVRDVANRAAPLTDHSG